MDNWIPCLGIQGKVTSEGHHATLKYPYLLLPGCSIFVERISFNFLKALRFLCVCVCTCTCVDLHICTQESTNRALLSLVGVARKGSLVEMFVFEIHRKIPFHRFGVTGVLHSKSKFCLEMHEAMESLSMVLTHQCELCRDPGKLKVLVRVYLKMAIVICILFSNWRVTLIYTIFQNKIMIYISQCM